MTSTAKPVGMALSSAHVAALRADRALTARLNAAGLAFAVAGIDRLDPTIPRSDLWSAGRAGEPSAAVLGSWAPDLGWLAVAAVRRDGPAGLARQIGAARDRADGWPGLVLGLRGHAAAARRGAGPAEGQAESLLGAEPGPVGPVLAWRAASTGEAAAASRVADVLIWPAGRPDRLDTVAAASSGGPRLFLEVPAAEGDLGARLARYLADVHVAGVVLRPEGDEVALREFTAYVLPELIGSGAFRTGWSGSLRERLSLRVPELLPA